MLFRSLKLVVLTALLSRSVGLPDLLTFVFSWQGDQLCTRTKYRGTEQHVFVLSVIKPEYVVFGESYVVDRRKRIYT